MLSFFDAGASHAELPPNRSGRSGLSLVGWPLVTRSRRPPRAGEPGGPILIDVAAAIPWWSGRPLQIEIA